MAQGSSNRPTSTDFFIRNKSKKLKTEVVNIAKANGMTYSQWCRSLIIKARDSAPINERNYSEDCD